jgi:hypothetical protein
MDPESRGLAAAVQPGVRFLPMRLAILFVVLAVGASLFLGYTLGRMAERRTLKFKLIDRIGYADTRLQEHLNRWLQEL